MADSGHYGTRDPGESRQGIYVCTADGRFLSSINHLDVERVLKTLKRGLMKWNQLPDHEREPKPVAAEMKIENRWEHQRPMDGLVLTAYSRDLHFKATPDSKPMKTWNVDSAWFDRKEMKSLLPKHVAAGQSFDFPDFFVARLCRLHFVDCVKGQTEAFQKSEIEGSRISATVVVADENKIKLQINGTSSGVCRSGRYPRGVVTKIIGDATFDKATERFTQFDMVAIGKRWGRTKYNDRLAQQSETPIGFAFQITQTDEHAVIPGIFWSYDASWIKR